MSSNRAWTGGNSWARMLQMKGFIAGVLVVIGLVAAAIYFSGDSSVTPDVSLTPEQLSVAQTVREDDHVRGATESGTLVVEYSDFQCPACGAYFPLIKQLEEEKGGSLTFVYRHLPLTAIHKHANPAAYAAEAAGKQGKFWEMHDVLFERQKEWSASTDPQALFEAYAMELTLNIDQFKTDMESTEIKAKVAGNAQEAIALGVTGTPTFFVNGKKMDNTKVTSYDDFLQLVNTLSSE